MKTGQFLRAMDNLIVKMTKCRKQYVRFKIQWVYGVFSIGISTLRQPILERSNHYTYSVPSKDSSSLYYTMANISCIVPDHFCPSFTSGKNFLLLALYSWNFQMHAHYLHIRNYSFRSLVV
jgi:hypothetical protein